MGTELNGIIIGGKVYELVPKGSYHCNDCDLYGRCNLPFVHLCHCFIKDMPAQYIFRLSKELTDKLKDKTGL